MMKHYVEVTVTIDVSHSAAAIAIRRIENLPTTRRITSRIPPIDIGTRTIPCSEDEVEIPVAIKISNRTTMRTIGTLKQSPAARREPRRTTPVDVVVTRTSARLIHKNYVQPPINVQVGYLYIVST